jgi:hypothetical protein
VLAARRLMLGEENVNRLESMKTDINTTKGTLVDQEKKKAEIQL